MEIKPEVELSALQKIYNIQITQTPQYTSMIDTRISSLNDIDAHLLEKIASSIIRLAGNRLEEFCRDYKWICDTFLMEEIHFRRTGKYRLKSFNEAYEEVYSKPEIMVPYMNGLLMTQLWWPNHTHSIRYLTDKFLANCIDNYSLLEIGPGHGLLSYFSATDPRCKYVEAWDVSRSSLDATFDSLQVLGVSNKVYLKEQNLYEASSDTSSFDAIIFSEVIEHLEEPRNALEILGSLLKPEGRIYINMPINSPAPDHLFNLDTPDHFLEFVESCGLVVTDKDFFPMAGYSLKQAIKQKLTISCIVIAEVG